jgi:hypothetical protein
MGSGGTFLRRNAVKRCIGVTILLLNILAGAYSLAEGYGTIGFGCANQSSFMGDAGPPGNITGNGNRNMLVFRIHHYLFFNRENTGLFFAGGLMIPPGHAVDDGNLKAYSSIIGELTLGFGYRHGITSRLMALGGIGAESGYERIAYDFYNTALMYTDSHYNFGIGGEIALKFDVTNAAHLFIGFHGSYAFARVRLLNPGGEDASGWRLGSIISASPFIGVGFNWVTAPY